MKLPWMQRVLRNAGRAAAWRRFARAGMGAVAVSMSTGPARTMELSAQRASAAVTTLASGGAALLLASAAGNALSYAFGIFIARSLGTEQFGLYALGLTVFNLLALFAPLALDIGVIKFVSGDLAAGERGRIRRTIVSAGAIVVVSGLLAALGLALSASWLSSSLYHKPALSTVLVLFAAAIPFATLTTVLLGALQAFQTVRYMVWIKYVWEPVGKFALAGLALALGLGLYGVLGGIVIVLATSALIAFRCVMRVMPRDGSRSDYEAGAFQTLLAFSAPLIVSNIFGILAPRSDMLILGYWADAKQVGVYNAAFQTSAIIALVLGAFDAAVAPIIGSLIGSNDPGPLKALYQVTSRWALTLTAPIFVLMVIWGRDLLAFFGPTFTLGVSCLLVLAVAQLFNTATGAAGSVILMSGHSRWIMINSMIVGALLICSNVALIPKYGILGAAVASSTCQIFVSLLRVVEVWRLQRILPFSWSMTKPAVAAVVATGTGLIARGAVGVGGASQGSLAVLVLGIYCGALFLCGFEEADSVTASRLWERLTVGARLGRR